MTGEEFFIVWDDATLRNYLVDVSKAFTKNMTIQEDLLQEAWIRISFAPTGKTTEFYMHEGFKAMDCFYHKERDGWRLTRWGKEHKDLDNRVKYVEKKYKTYSEKTPKTLQ